MISSACGGSFSVNLDVGSRENPLPRSCPSSDCSDCQIAAMSSTRMLRERRDWSLRPPTTSVPRSRRAYVRSSIAARNACRSVDAPSIVRCNPTD